MNSSRGTLLPVHTGSEGRSPLDRQAVASPGQLDDAVWRTILYADIFDYPLTHDEVFAYLHVAAVRQDVEAAIARCLHQELTIRQDGEFLFLPGRESIVELRRVRSAIAASLWPQARWYARALWSLPFVRMVAVTGSLAAGNTDADHDIDFFLVTEAGRLWTVRGLAVLLVRLARIHGDCICPNYLITTRSLHLDHQDLYSAHELVRMVPLHGEDVAEQFREQNTWRSTFLPHAASVLQPEPSDHLPLTMRMFKTAGELALRSPIGGKLESWESARKMKRLTLQSVSMNEAVFTADVCKGHCHGHRTRVAGLFNARVLRSPGQSATPPACASQ